MHLKTMAKVTANPDAAVARLQRITADPIINHREKRSDSQPRTGALNMYVIRNALPSVPLIAIAFTSVAEKKVARIDGSTAARTCRSM